MKLHQIMVLALVLASVAASPAMADKGGKNKGYGKSHSYNDDTWHDRHHDDDDVTIIIGGRDRDLIRNYIREDAFRHCPPGLAKKNPPCIPPGQAKKYRVGYPLPGDVVFVPVPDSWGLRAPYGYQYVQVDKDVLLIGEASKKVIDAVTLLSAVGN
jgi:hypothetical protein